MIPKILHFIWMQGLGAMPRDYRRCYDSWAPKHPKWEIRLWSRESIPPLKNSLVCEIDNPTVQCEIARFELVLR